MRTGFRLILLVLASVICVNKSIAQNKNASIILGGAATQIHGDGIAGYNKFGLEFGVSVQSPITEKIIFQPELLYFQKGSRSRADSPYLIKFKLNYLELPMLLGYEINENIQLQGGPSFGYFLNGSVYSGGLSSSVTGKINKVDLSFMLGGSYRFLANTSIKVRYSISVLPIGKTGNLVNDTASFLLIFHI